MWSLSGEAIVTADGVLFIIQVAEMAVQQYEYCVKVVNVTACYCLGTCTEQVSVLLKMFILWGYSAKVGRYLLELSVAASFGYLGWAHWAMEQWGRVKPCIKSSRMTHNFLANKKQKIHIYIFVKGCSKWVQTMPLAQWNPVFEHPANGPAPWYKIEQAAWHLVKDFPTCRQNETRELNLRLI